MPSPPIAPGVYIEEVPSSTPLIETAPSSTSAFIGCLGSGPLNLPQRVSSLAAFQAIFPPSDAPTETATAVQLFFANGGTDAWIVGTPTSAPADLIGDPVAATGLCALTPCSPYSILCMPDAAPDPSVYAAAATFCEQQRALLLIDPPSTVNTIADATSWLAAIPQSANAAAFFPRLLLAGAAASAAPSGAAAGIIARFETASGVWKAPAGTQATIVGVTGLNINIRNSDNDVLNSANLNCIRTFNLAAPVLWGARTLSGNINPELKYISVLRTKLMIERSILADTPWVVFEANTEPLWSRLRQAVENFLFTLFRLGAFPGAKPEQAFFVRCDATTTTLEDRANGRLNLFVGFAPLRPSEFINLRLTLQSSNV